MKLTSAFRGTLAVAIGSVTLALAAPAANGAFGVAAFDAGTCARNDETTPGGQCTRDSSPDYFYQQAAGHPPWGITGFTFNTTGGMPDGHVKDIRVDLPPGLSVNPQATPKCTRTELESGACPPEDALGTNYMTVSILGVQTTISATVYNIVQDPGMPSLFGMSIPLLRTNVYLEGGVAWDGDYHESFTIRDVPNTVPLVSSRLVFNGRAGDGTFITLPSPCEGPQTTYLHVDSYEDPGNFLAYSSTTPVGVIGCENLPFGPTVNVSTDTREAGAPAGVTVDVGLPQNADGIDRPNTATLRNVSITLPEGMSINPSAATGLQGCTDAQLGQGTSRAVACPAASAIGTVAIETPVLPAHSLTGTAYLGQPLSNDPQSGEQYRLFLVAESARYGVSVRLTGHIRADPSTGQLTATFADNPQVPVSLVRVALRGGPQAPLVNPQTCGRYVTHATMSSWGGQVARPTDTTTIDQGCAGGTGFAPGFSAGVSNPLAGISPSFGLKVGRSDADQILSRIDVSLPPGLLAKTAGIPVCTAGRAAAGTCEESSRLGSVAVTAGAGPSPFALGGRVYLTGPYGGGPYGLSIVVPAIAGPFNLGDVVVRAAISLDRNDAHVRTLSDPLPTIVGGVPLLVRSVDVIVDRPDTMRNPTSCATRPIAAGLTSLNGLFAGRSVPLTATDCGRLPFSPRMSIELTGAHQTREGRHPGVAARVVQRAGQANISEVKVTLPLSLALDPGNAEALCEYDAGLRDACPESSVIGTATARTPLLPHPLTGKVYFVKGVRIDPSGRQIKTLPTLLVALRGDVALNLRATSAVDAKSRLVTTFAGLPDAAVSSFDMRLQGGRHGILTVTSQAGLCTGRKQRAQTRSTGQNGKTTSVTTILRTPCPRRPVLGRVRALPGGRVQIGVIAFGPGRIVASGASGELGRVSRRARARHRVVLTLKPTKRAIRELARSGSVLGHVSVRYVAKNGASVTVRKMVRLRR